MNTDARKPRWFFQRREKVALTIALLVLLGFGAILERRTALRRVPMTDLSVFAAAAAAVEAGQDVYAAKDMHGWHYVYPPALAILFSPLAFAGPAPAPPLEPGVVRTPDNTPWGYDVKQGGNFYGLHQDNLRFFWIVAVWFLISVAMTLLSAQLIACALQGRGWLEPPPAEAVARQLWWRLRWLPVLLCITSVGTEFSRGQVDVIMLLAVCAGLYLAAQGWGLMAGMCLSIPAVIKLLPPLILLLPFWSRRWRVVYGIALGLGLSVVVIPVAKLGPAGTLTAYQNWVTVLVKPGMGAGHDTSRAQELTNINSTDNQSLLAFIHNWTYHSEARGLRPPQATSAARGAALALGGAALLAFAGVVGFRRQRSPRELVIIAGILIGLVFVVSPMVHNYYYLMLLPLLAGLVDECLDRTSGRGLNRGIVGALGFFLLIDLLVRLPGIGSWLRDCGLPFLSLVVLMIAGVSVLLRKPVQIKP